jgi:hypothetical protein
VKEERWFISRRPSRSFQEYRLFDMRREAS